MSTCLKNAPVGIPPVRDGAAAQRFLRWAVELAGWIDSAQTTEREPEARRRPPSGAAQPAVRLAPGSPAATSGRRRRPGVRGKRRIHARGLHPGRAPRAGRTGAGQPTPGALRCLSALALADLSGGAYGGRRRACPRRAALYNPVKREPRHRRARRNLRRRPRPGAAAEQSDGGPARCRLGVPSNANGPLLPGSRPCTAVE